MELSDRGTIHFPVASFLNYECLPRDSSAKAEVLYAAQMHKLLLRSSGETAAYMLEVPRPCQVILLFFVSCYVQKKRTKIKILLESKHEFGFFLDLCYVSILFFCHSLLKDHQCNLLAFINCIVGYPS